HSHACHAAALAGLGQLAEARSQFAAATDLSDQPQLHSFLGIWEAELKLATGDRAAARSQSVTNRAMAVLSWGGDVKAQYDSLVGRCALPDFRAQARSHLRAAREYAGRSGAVEVNLRCYHLAAEVAHHERDFATAVAEAEAGIELADSCGFGRWS